MGNSRKRAVRFIFTAYVTRPDGTRVYAKQYGLKAFRIPVNERKQ